ncbi:MAG: FAD-dependent oxidoreductase [Bacilli bacterium]|nr:FAD-dependent oxidoreductase [Bacilli bacterium]
MQNVDVLIIGAGPAGLSAALYLKRAGVSFALIDKSAPGGKLLNIAEIANYPGVMPTSGFELANALVNSVTSLGVEIGYGDVSSITKVDNKFITTTDYENYESIAVIVGTGLSNVPTIKGEKTYYGKGVSYCATCDGALYKGKDVAVVGHEEKALEEAQYLSNLVNKVYLIIDDEEMHASPIMFESLKSKENVEVLFGNVLEIKGDTSVTSIITNDKELMVSAIFPLSGEKSASSFLAPLGLKTKNGFIHVDENMMSEVPGIFAIGDVQDKKLRQVVTACSDGAIASASVSSYIRRMKR